MSVSRCTRIAGSAHAGTWLGAIVTAIVLGMLGMHTLTTPAEGAHGVATTAEVGWASLSVGPPMAHDTMTTSMPESADPQSVGAPSNSSPDGQLPVAGGHGLGHLLMLCAAMLAAATVTLVLTRWLSARATSVRRLVRRSPSPQPGALARLGTGPPSAWSFSVIRC
jgi:hypothetical protein